MADEKYPTNLELSLADAASNMEWGKTILESMPASGERDVMLRGVTKIDGYIQELWTYYRKNADVFSRAFDPDATQPYQPVRDE